MRHVRTAACFGIFLGLASAVFALTQPAPADKNSSDTASISPSVQNRVNELEKLKKDNPSKFDKVVGERKKRVHQKMEELRKKDPKKFDELKKKVSERRDKKGEHHRENSAKAQAAEKTRKPKSHAPVSEPKKEEPSLESAGTAHPSS